MENTKTVTDNELIAEFMGYERSMDVWENGEYAYTMKIPLSWNKWVIPSHMDFHKSWDWLMPVVQKIVAYCDEIIALSTKWFNKYIRPLNLALMRANIEAVYKAVIEFIHWYSSQKK